MPQFETLMSSKAAMIGLAVVAFLVAALLVLVLVRMLFGGRLRMPGGRARQARLGIVDAFDLDRQRQLIIVRRDNTEHLIMIGGPNDLLIESEIVRVEARDFRDARREKTPEAAFPAAPGFTDARVPAPFTPVERPDGKVAEDPLLPMPLPQTAPAEPQAGAPTVEPPPPARTPTFPLPPRRPPPTPERKPVPPKLPESVTRADENTPGIAGSDPIPGPGAPPDIRAPGAAIPPVAPPRTIPPPFLKPLPPRPPVRPLPRTTPKPLTPAAAPNPSTLPAADAAPKAADPISGTASVTPPLEPTTPIVPARPTASPASTPNSGEAPPSPPAAPVAAAAPPVEPPPRATPSEPAPAPPAPATEGPDALESLEEEMAKLLGRGPS